jgi:dCMP deaminase
MYTTFFSCSSCAKLVIQAGIKRFVAPILSLERWADSLKLSQDMYDEAGVDWKLVEMSARDKDGPHPTC